MTSDTELRMLIAAVAGELIREHIQGRDENLEQIVKAGVRGAIPGVDQMLRSLENTLRTAITPVLSDLKRRVALLEERAR